VYDTRTDGTWWPLIGQEYGDAFSQNDDGFALSVRSFVYFRPVFVRGARKRSRLVTNNGERARDSEYVVLDTTTTITQRGDGTRGR